ncbi:hypothetical protein JHK84_041435 [Glycine max]|nr:hypothetical protein JHK84_041435 [Glycine max]
MIEGAMCICMVTSYCCGEGFFFSHLTNHTGLEDTYTLLTLTLQVPFRELLEKGSRSGCFEIPGLAGDLIFIPHRYNSFWKELDHAKNLVKNRQDLNMEKVGFAALFGLECFAWFWGGEIVGRGSYESVEHLLVRMPLMGSCHVSRVTLAVGCIGVAVTQRNRSHPHLTSLIRLAGIKRP